MRASALALALSLLPACIVAEDAVPLVDVKLDVLSQYNFRGMPQNDNGVLQGETAVNLPSRDGGSFDLSAWANMDLSNDTGDAWFPDGHGGEFTEWDLLGAYSRSWGKVDLTVGLLNYSIANGLEFANGPAFSPRGPTAEIFASISREVLGLFPSFTVHYDYDEVDDFYLEAGVGKSFPIKERFNLDLDLNLGWSSDGASLWSYGIPESGLADLRAGAGLSYALSRRTTLRALVAASTIVDSTIADWFDVIGIDSNNVWGGLGVTWSF